MCALFIFKQPGLNVIETQCQWETWIFFSTAPMRTMRKIRGKIKKAINNRNRGEKTTSNGSVSFGFWFYLCHLLWASFHCHSSSLVHDFFFFFFHWNESIAILFRRDFSLLYFLWRNVARAQCARAMRIVVDISLESRAREKKIEYQRSAYSSFSIWSTFVWVAHNI